MIDLQGFREEIEHERLWREDELRLLKNKVQEVENLDKQNILRKTLIVMLYAYFEGICKFSFTAYVRNINKLAMENHEVSWSILASSFNKVFKELNSTDKESIFNKGRPDDSELHQFSRRKRFVEEFSSLMEQKVLLNEDEIIDLESNIKPIVIKKVLFLLGIEHSEVDKWSGKINKLLRYRNNIAHGSMKDGIKKETYQELEDEIFQIINSIVLYLSKAIIDKKYTR